MIKKKTVFGAQTTRKWSALHTKVVGLIREAYPSFTVLEDAPIEVLDGGRQNTLFVDICVRELELAIECHGQQHFKYVNHFHGSQAGFEAAQRRDQAKKEAVVAAGFTYLMIRFDEEKTLTLAKLLKRISKAIKEKQ